MSVKKLSKDVIASWPEIFEEINLNSIPLKYLCTLNVKFKDKRVWTIDLTSKNKLDQWNIIEKNIFELITNYKHHIESIDVKLDTDRIKRDITRQTNKFLRKQRLA
jgi:hypothetical protein